MKKRTTKVTSESRWDHRKLGPWLRGAILAGLFLYVWKGIGPHLLYSGFGVFTAYPIVSREGTFLHTTFSTVGGTLRAVAALLAHSYQIAWLGALVVTSILAVLFLGIQRLLRSVQAGRSESLAWIPLLLALAIYNNRYEDPLPILLAVGLSVWTVILHGALPVRTPPGRAGLFFILFLMVYYLAGASALVFAGIVCLTEALFDRKIMPAIVQAALAAGGAFVLGRLVFDLELRAVYTAATPWDPTAVVRLSPLANWLALYLYAFVPGLIVLALLGRVLMEIDAGKPKQVRRRRAESRVWPGLRVFVVALTAVLCLVSSRTCIRYERALHYYAQHRNWERVLALANRMRGRHSFTRAGVFEINRALAHEGRLGSELCAFPQDNIKTLFMSFDDMPGRLLHAKSLELYLDLGCVNAAEKNAYELLDHEGPSPHVLEALVRIHLAKGQYKSARVAFRALQKCVGCWEYVRRWQPVMADPAQVEANALIQSWRRVRLTRDNTSIGISLATLKSLMEDTPDHRLAFEYLMAAHLLRHEQVELMSRLPLLKLLGYKELPRHYAEALLVYSLMTGTPADTQGWTIEPDLQRQFQEIRGIVTKADGNDHAVFDTLVPKYGDTYMFYSMFDLCGLK